jgi:hypothetical protein
MKIEKLFDGCEKPPKNAIIIDPFAGNGDTIKWIGKDNLIIPYDIDPVAPNIIKRNIFINRLKYYGTYVITRPPQTSKYGSEDRTVFEQYGTDNLYKCFIKCLIVDPPSGGIIVVPESFINGARESLMKRRSNFFRVFKPLRINVFDRNTLVINFTKRHYISPSNVNEPWNIYFYNNAGISSSHLVWVHPRIIPIEMPLPDKHSLIDVKITYTQNGIWAQNGNWLQTDIVFDSIDTIERRMGLYILAAKDVESNTKPFLYIRGFLSKKLQQRLCFDFNKWVENFRADRINSIIPLEFITQEIAINAIRCIIWSYRTGVKA